MAVGKPWSNVTVSRSLTALKFFYDLKFGMLHCGLDCTVHDRYT